VTLEAVSTSCRLTVSDVGDALPADHEAIFKPFVTHKRPETRHGNLGLGLFVARTIVGHHRGSLRVEPLPGAIGARFIVELPLASEREKAEHTGTDSVVAPPVPVRDA
jgi:signal transduction histidine kinase